MGVGDNGVPTQQDKAYAALQQTVQLNPKGRHRVADAVHVTADRQQHDLTRLRCHEDQKDKELVKKRRFLNDFHPTPSTDSVSEHYRLGDVPISQEPGSRVLSEDARRGLTRWQIRGPERHRQEAAQICKALRSIDSAVKALPTYQDHLRGSRPGGHATERLFEQSFVKQASKSGNYMRQLPMMVPGAGLSRSMPTIPPSYMTKEEIKNVEGPGGYMCGLMDCEPLQFKKNRQRAIVSKMVQGGACSWATTNEVNFATPKKQLSLREEQTAKGL